MGLGALACLLLIISLANILPNAIRFFLFTEFASLFWSNFSVLNITIVIYGVCFFVFFLIGFLIKKPFPMMLLDIMVILCFLFLITIVVSRLPYSTGYHARNLSKKVERIISLKQSLPEKASASQFKERLYSHVKELGSTPFSNNIYGTILVSVMVGHVFSLGTRLREESPEKTTTASESSIILAEINSKIFSLFLENGVLTNETKLQGLVQAVDQQCIKGNLEEFCQDVRNTVRHAIGYQ